MTIAYWFGVATAVWRGQLTFGLLTFPVKLYAAARRETISFRNLRKREDEEPERELAGEPAAASQKASPGSALKTSMTPQPTQPGQNVSNFQQEAAPEPVYTAEDRVTNSAALLASPQVPAQVVKGYEFEKDCFVAIDPAELRKLARSTSKDLEVTEFVHWEEIDPAFLDASYFIVPDPSGEKPYSLLYAAMKKTGFAALAQIAMHGREQILVLRYGTKGLVGHTMYYATEVRRDQEFAASTDNFNSKEMQLASTLIEQMAGPFEPERFVDAYKARVQALVDAKVKRAASAPAAEAEQPVNRKPPVDIMDALKRSLEAAAQRKAPQKEAVRSKRKTA